ncbi:hypothetical protein PR003_g27299 [Phytophthora rubi]|uniref:Uncharacterized protein n=1 Tax=Phytophthora rubi TaxID=129364 RepID=A0A6A4BZF5_9STRA|nr:hypothetical protein PR003_g27299 [Phytophthora rubi]
MVWTTLAIAAMALSCVATGVTSYSLRRSWDLQISSVRWLFTVFFTCYCLYGADRVAYMVTTMDRGAEKEQEQIRWYLWRVWPVIGSFTIAETVLAVVKGSYTTATQVVGTGVKPSQFFFSP